MHFGHTLAFDTTSVINLMHENEIE